jgi:hypothetical protein
MQMNFIKTILFNIFYKKNNINNINNIYNQMKLQEFGAYLQCYKNPYATYKCLESFRRFYPDNTIVLLSDNGYDYTKMAEYFKCIYIHSNENVTFIYDDPNNHGKFENTFKLIERLVNAFKLCNEEYVMWLEDDVSINNEITDTFEYHLNGFCPNFIPEVSIIKLQEKYGHLDVNKKYRFSGHGGSVYKCDFFIECLKNKEIIHDIIENWVYYDFPSTIAQDFLFSVIITLSGGTIGPYIGHYDNHYDLDNRIFVQHQFKEYYNIPLPDELQRFVKEM